MPKFDLTTEPWIVCIKADGSPEQLGLRDVLARAHELKALGNESPLLDAALLRLCLAILHRCFGPSDKQAWRALQAAQRFDAAKIGAYLDAWRSGFDLFDAERPFFQVARLVEQSKNYTTGLKPAREIIAEQSSYGGPRELFASRPSEGETIPFAVAARWLVAIQAFATGGLLTRDTANGDPTSATAAPLCSTAVVTIRGRTLFDTLLLNLVTYPAARIFPWTAKDAPAWELPPQPKFTKRPCHGWLDWLTWQSRRIQLIPHDDSGIGSFLLLNGCEVMTAENIDIVDPMAARRYSDTQKKFLPIAFTTDRAVWRDSTALYQVTESSDVRGARVVEELAQRKVPDAQELELQLYGQRPNKASISFTRSEVVPLPAKLIHNPELVAILRDELAKAEAAQSALRSALYLAFQHVLSLGERKPPGEEVGNMIENSRGIPKYWGRLKTAFDAFLVSLVETDGSATSVSEFRSAIWREAGEAFRAAALSSSSSTRALKAFTLGYDKLQLELRKAGLSPPAVADRQGAMQAEAKA